jgi:hypothetical protein
VAWEVAQPIEAFVKGAVEQEQLRAGPRRTVTAEGAKLAIE